MYNSFHTKEKIKEIYNSLFSKYGPQGWWPLRSMAGKKGFDEKGYHKEIYSYPKSSGQRFEVVVGAILTQNTSWKNVEKALDNLFSLDMMSPEKILNSNEKELADAIRSAGYFNQKTKKLKNISEWFIQKDKEICKFKTKEVSNLEKLTTIRNDLLKVNGVGFETADSILLYAYNLPIFVVDAYTKRLFTYLSLLPQIKQKEQYSFIQETVHSTFSDLSVDEKVRVFNEFHALIVEWGKKNPKRKGLSYLI